MKDLSEDLVFPGGKFQTQEDQRLGLKTPVVAPVCNPNEAGDQEFKANLVCLSRLSLTVKNAYWGEAGSSAVQTLPDCRFKP